MHALVLPCINQDNRRKAFIRLLDSSLPLSKNLGFPIPASEPHFLSHETPIMKLSSTLPQRNKQYNDSKWHSRFHVNLVVKIGRIICRREGNN